MDGLANGIRLKNVYKFVCRDPNGNIKWVEEVENLVPTQGLNHIIDVVLRNQSQNAAWYVGLIDNAGFSAIAAGDTAAQIGGSNGWSESTAYDEAVRQTLTLDAAAAGESDNEGNEAVFTCSTNSTVIKGAFVVSSSTKGGTAGTLFGAAAFGTTKSLDDNDTLTVTVTVTVSSS